MFREMLKAGRVNNLHFRTAKADRLREELKQEIEKK